MRVEARRLRCWFEGCNRMLEESDLRAHVRDTHPLAPVEKEAVLSDEEC